MRGGLITDTCGEFTIADCDNIATILNNLHCSYSLNRDEINELASTFENAAEMRKYPIRYDYERVAKAFSIAIAKLEYASEHQDVEAYWNNPVSSSGGFDDTNSPETTEKSEDKPQKRSKKENPWITAALCAVILGVGLVLRKK